MPRTGSEVSEALRGLFWAVSGMDIHLHGAGRVAKATAERLLCVNQTIIADTFKLVTASGRSPARQLRQTTALGNSGLVESEKQCTEAKGHCFSCRRSPANVTPSIKGSNTSRRSLHFDKNIAVEEADNGLQDYTDLQPRAPVAELLGEAAQLARCLPVFLQAIEKSGTANLRRLFLFWAAVKWIQDAFSFVHSLQNIAVDDMQQPVPSLRANGALDSSMQISEPREDSPDAHRVNFNTGELTAWKGILHGTYLAYALLHWAVAAPNLQSGERACALLGRLFGSCHPSRDAVNITQRIWLPVCVHGHAHPLVQSSSYAQRVRQRKNQRSGNDNRKCAKTAVQHLHILQQNILLCEQLLSCRRILEQLLQLLQLFRVATQPYLLAMSHSKTTGSNTLCIELAVACAHVLRLAAFVMQANRCKALCGVWISKNARDMLLPSN